MTFPPHSAFIGVMFTDRAPTPPALLTTREAADRLGLTTTSLHDLRCKDDGLPIVQKGLLVGYQLEDKHVLCPERVRLVPEQFSWIDQALVQRHFIDRCDRQT